jgi:hypothetical protein
MIRVGERLETLAQSGSIFTNGLGLLYHEFRLHNDFAKSFLTRGLSPLPLCVLDD